MRKLLTPKVIAQAINGHAAKLLRDGLAASHDESLYLAIGHVERQMNAFKSVIDSGGRAGRLERELIGAGDFTNDESTNGGGGFLRQYHQRPRGQGDRNGTDR